jgi:hypothetical protein
MTKQTAPFALMLPPRDPGTTATGWLYSALRQRSSGRLRSGARMPAVTWPAIIGCREDGGGLRLLKSEVPGGAGGSAPTSRRCCRTGCSVDRPAAAGASGGDASLRAGYPTSGAGSVASAWKAAVRAFRANRPALDLFPRRSGHRSARRLRRASMDLLLGCGPMGCQPLQEAVAEA